jgi:hypothetical protein
MGVRPAATASAEMGIGDGIGAEDANAKARVGWGRGWGRREEAVCASSFFMGFVFWGSGLSAVDPGLVSRLRPAGRPDDGVVRAVVRAVWRAGVASATLLLPGPGVLDRVRARTSSRAGRPGPAS